MVTKMRLSVCMAVLALAVLGGASRPAGAAMLVADPGSLRQWPLPPLLILPSGEALRTFDAVRGLAGWRAGTPVVYDAVTGYLEPYRPAADERLARARPDTVLVWEPAHGRLRPIRPMSERVSAILSEPGRVVVLTDVASGPSLMVRVAETGPRTAALLAGSRCGPCPACRFTDADHDGIPACDDCRDDDPAVRPGAQEVCNGIDDDCDGLVDTADPSMLACDDGIPCTADACGGDAGCTVLLYDDRACDDGIACTVDFCTDEGCINFVENVQPETCNGIDDDCDGLIDADDPSMEGCGDDLFCNGVETCDGGVCFSVYPCSPSEFGCASYDGSCDEASGCTLILNQDLCPSGTNCTETGECCTETGDCVAFFGLCGNGRIDPEETCGEDGLPACPFGEQCVSCLCRQLGDCVNDGGNVDLFDVLENIDLVLGRHAASPEQVVLCDDDCDTDIDLFDILIGIDALLGKVPTPLLCP